MSSANTFNGFVNLPAINGASYTSESGYVIPSSGTYAGLPSPAQIAANWLVVPALPGDVTGGVLDYGRPFKVRVSFAANIAQSETITVNLYQCTAANFAAGVAATSKGTQIATWAQATGAARKGQFYLEAILTWDSTSKILNGFYQGWNSLNGTTGGVAKSQTALAAAPSSLAENDLNFFPTFTCGTGTSDTIGPIDIIVDRM